MSDIPRSRCAVRFYRRTWEVFVIDPTTRVETYVFDIAAPKHPDSVWHWQEPGLPEPAWKPLYATHALYPESIASMLAEDLGRLPPNRRDLLRIREDDGEHNTDGNGSPRP